MAGQEQEALRLEWVNRNFVLDNNTFMFYVELPDYEKANANWGLNLNKFVVATSSQSEIWINRDADFEYSYISVASDKWTYATTTKQGDTSLTFSELPSGFRGFVRIDISTMSFHANVNFANYYRVLHMDFGYNAVGGECGDIVFGGVLYYPDEDRCNATLMTSSRCGDYYQLGGNKDSVLVTKHATRWNVTIKDSAGNTSSQASASEYDAQCLGGQGVSIDSKTGQPITEKQQYYKEWIGMDMQPGVDSFIVYVELPTYTATTPALYIDWPALTQDGVSWPISAKPGCTEYMYCGVGDVSWKKGMTDADGALKELGSGFKGYIKFDLKKFEFFQDNTTRPRKEMKLTENYQLAFLKMYFNHVGGENGKLIIGSAYTVLSDSESTTLSEVSTSQKTEKPLTIEQFKSMAWTSASVNQNGNTQMVVDNSKGQVAAENAEGFSGAYVISSKDGSLTGAVASKTDETFSMLYTNLEMTPKSSSMIFYVEVPDYKKSGAKWGLNIQEFTVEQNGVTYWAKLSRRAKYSYLSTTGTEWVEGTIRAEGDKNAVFANLPSNFKGYICINVTDISFHANNGNRFNPSADFKTSKLSIGYNSVGGECGNLVLGGILYRPAENSNLTTNMMAGGKIYKLIKNPDSNIINEVGAACWNVTISNTNGGESASSSSTLTADSIVYEGNTSVALGSKTDSVITDLHQYSKEWLGLEMVPGVDTFMTYIEMPTYSEQDAALYISSPAFSQSGKTDGKWINGTGGKYSYISIYDGEWHTASIGSNGELSEIGSGFKGYVKFDIKTFPGFNDLKNTIDITAPYELRNAQFRYKYVGGDNGNLVIGGFYAVADYSDSDLIAVKGQRSRTLTRYVYGDIIANGKIELNDVNMARKVLVGTENIQENAVVRSDANQDGKSVDVKDLVHMVKVSQGKEEALRWQDNVNNSGLELSKWVANGIIPYYPEGTITQTVAGGGTNVMKSVGTSAESYQKYLKALEFAGFKLYTNNTIDNNLFATYTNDDLTVNAYYIDSNKTVRIVWEPKGALPGLESDNVYDTTIEADTILTGIPVDDTTTVEGMLYVIKLEDNSFVILDGGYADGGNGNSKKLYQHLVSQTPEGQKPVIAAWIFTHAHSDHIGNFSEFSLNYHNDVVVEKFYYNFPSDEEIASNSPGILGTHIKEYTVFKRVMNEYYEDVPKVKVHTGNKFYVRNAEFEVLQTFEDFYPDKLASHNFNTTSSVYRMYVGGQSFMWLGDATPASEQLLKEQFGDYLKSDVLQLAHHGIDGWREAYMNYAPSYALWPAAKQFYEQYKDSEANAWILQNTKETIVTGYGKFSVKLPMNLTGEYTDHPYSDSVVNPEWFN